MSLQNIPPWERQALHALSREKCSPRERQVLAWWSLGYGTERIGVKLGLHESTVRTYLRRALGKLEAAVLET